MTIPNPSPVWKELMDLAYGPILKRMQQEDEWLKQRYGGALTDTNTGETRIVDSESGGMKGQKLAQFSQIPPDVLWELAEHYGKGVAKYPDSEDGEPNWQRGYSWRLSVDALGRHLLAFLNGEDIDPETGSSHLTAVMWHAMTLRWFQLHEKGRDYR